MSVVDKALDIEVSLVPSLIKKDIEKEIETTLSKNIPNIITKIKPTEKKIYLISILVIIILVGLFLIAHQ
ncbi:hypothetical protein CL622_04160 [archaeon]|nr:hypothetical protein [archaeon]